MFRQTAFYIFPYREIHPLSIYNNRDGYSDSALWEKEVNLDASFVNYLVTLHKLHPIVPSFFIYETWVFTASLLHRLNE